MQDITYPGKNERSLVSLYFICVDPSGSFTIGVIAYCTGMTVDAKWFQLENIIWFDFAEAK